MEAFMMAHSVAVRYSDSGLGGQVVLLLHGYGEALDQWDHFAGLLGKSLRVVRLDLPGSGFSDWGSRSVIDIDFMAAVAADLLDKLSIDRATVVGHSMGGYVAVAMADLFPSKVKHLVMMHSSPAGDTADKIAHREREIELIAGGKKELLSSVNPARGFAPCNVDRCVEAIDELAEQIMLTEDSAMIATLRGMASRPDRSEFFASTTIPILMFFGRYDNYIPSEAAEGMIAKFPRAQYAWLEHSGHSSFIEEPPRVAQILMDFISKN
ncbi:MAG: alpha/beta hydrolase [Mucinivorans sp.]